MQSSGLTHTGASGLRTATYAGSLLIAVVLLVVLFREGSGTDAVLPAGPNVGAGPSTPDSHEPRTEEGDALERDARIRVDVYGELLQLARRDPRAFRVQIVRMLAEPTTTQARLDALRALDDLEDPAAVPELAAALANAKSGVVVHTFALERLLPRAEGDAQAREGLLGFLRLQPEDVTQRAAAFRQLLRCGRGDQITRCLTLVAAETEPDVVVAAVQGLQASRDPKSRTQAASLHWRHPDPKVRQRLRALGIGR